MQANYMNESIRTVTYAPPSKESKSANSPAKQSPAAVANFMPQDGHRS